MNGPRRLLLAVDFNARTEALVKTCAAISSVPEGPEVLVLHALESEVATEAFARTESAARALGRRVATLGGRAGATTILRFGSAESLIQATVIELGPELVVLGWGRDSQLGSVARAVARAASCSVLFVGSEAPELTLPGRGSVMDRLGRDPALVCLEARDVPPLARQELLAEAAGRSSAYLLRLSQALPAAS